MKLVSVVTACFNEEENVEETYRRVREVFAALPAYRYEHVFIDNSSTDRTVEILRRLAREDRNLKVIVNSRNFGHTRSPVHGMLQARGDAIISIVADLQEPLELLPVFLEKWEAGARIVMGVRTGLKENPVMSAFRQAYYDLIGRLSEVELTKNFYGFGLYDRSVLDLVRQMDDPYPYWRGLISEIGLQPVKVEYVQSPRKRGSTKGNLYTLYNLAMNGITSHSKVPLRLATMLGFATSALSFLVGMAYLVYKLLFWQRFQVGVAPLVIGIFFFSSVQMFFIGILGEYIGSIHTQVVHRPLVFEKERINFDD